MTQSLKDDPESVVEVHRGTRCPAVLLCEHASALLPSPWKWPVEDEWITRTHWCVDIGAAEMCRTLSERTGCSAVLAGFSRLLIDANRDLESDTLLRSHADGKPVYLNQNIADDELQTRIEKYWKVYHSAASQAVASVSDSVVIGVHSFTDNYEGNVRLMEVGVLFDHDEAFGVWAANWLKKAGLEVALNEPYSGRNGLMYSPQRHAAKHGRRAIELELRQDLVGDPTWRETWMPVFEAFLQASVTWKPD